MTKFKTILWLIEAVSRIKTESPTFFKMFMALGFTIIALAAGIYFIEFYKIIPLPGFVSWLNDGWFVGFGSGIVFASSLTVKNNSITSEKAKKLPLTAKKDGID